MKKFLTIILTIALIMSMGTAVFADDTTNVTINKTYKLIGAGTSPAETFNLEQVESGTVIDGDAPSAPDLGTITGATFAAGEATDVGYTKNINIVLPSYTKVGKYEYTLKETIPSPAPAGITYYNENIKLVVTVSNGASGLIRTANVYNSSNVKISQIENTYSTGNLNVSKTVTGIMGDKDKYFEFSVTLTGETGKSYAANYSVSGSTYPGNPTAIAVDGTAATFHLKDGETISIANLPYGVTYTVTEKDYSTEGYTTTQTGDTGTINAADQTAAFTNEKGGSIDTGLIVDNLPYIAILGIVALAGIAMMFRRRRVEK